MKWDGPYVVKKHLKPKNADEGNVYVLENDSGFSASSFRVHAGACTNLPVPFRNSGGWEDTLCVGLRKAGRACRVT